MAKQTVNIGITANDGTGDQLRNAFNKLNQNNDEIYGNNFVTELMLNDDIVGADELKVTGDGTSGQLLSSNGDGTMTWADASSTSELPVYIGSSHSTFLDKKVYIFVNTTPLTHTLPVPPPTGYLEVGFSFKVVLRSAEVNTFAQNSNPIMGLLEDLVLDNTNASFEFYYAGGAQGWVIIGAN